MQKKNQNLVNQCCNLYELGLSEFCEKFNLKESTLKTWRKSLPSYGKLLLEQLIGNYHLKRELEIKADKLSKLQSLLEE
jgi:hypothetical protein